MNKFDGVADFELVYAVVNYGVGSKLLSKAKESGISGGTVCLGSGTVSNSILNFLSLYDERKEIVLLGGESSIIEKALTQLNKYFKFEKPNHGIIFTVSMFKIIGSRCNKCNELSQKSREEEKAMYQVIISIVNRGKAEEVIEAAKECGAKGGTIINGRGSGVNETIKLFNMDIEPEKEIVMIIANTKIAEDIIMSINKKLEIDKPGNGIVFVQDVKRVYGIYE